MTEIELLGETYVSVHGARYGKVAFGVFLDGVEIATPLIEWDFEEGCLKDWSDCDLNCSVAEEKGFTADDVSGFIQRNRKHIEETVITAHMGGLLVDYIESQLQDLYGTGIEVRIQTHPDMNRELGKLYGNDECIEDNAKSTYYGCLYQLFQPLGSSQVYKCYYRQPEDKIDWSDINYSEPDGVELDVDTWGYPN